MSHLFTVGHSNHDFEKFINLLTKHSIEVIVDVRSSPYSRYLPHYNRDELKTRLKEYGIKYLYLGEELGARRAESECYSGDTAKYKLIAKTKLFLDGLQRIEKGLETHRISLMCSEKDPLTCHRTILVGRTLISRGLPELSHILEDGSIETHDAAVSRLLHEYDRDTLSLFGQAQDIDEVYELRASEIEYKRATS